MYYIKPLAYGGTSDAANLRLLCRAHNLHAARKVFGKEFIANKISEHKALSRESKNQAVMIEDRNEALSRESNRECKCWPMDMTFYG